MQQQTLLSRLFCALIGLVFITTILSTGFSPVRAATVAPAGSGTSASPFLISNLQDLQWLQEYLANAANDGGYDKHFRQTADIDLGTIADWTPLGQSASGFRGSYDGQGYAISHLKIVISAESNSGLFAVNNGTIVGLGVVDVAITGGLTTDQQVGALTGSNKGTIQRCWATGSIATAALATGGLVGQMTTGIATVPITLTDSFSRVDITNPTVSVNSHVGGLVGDVAAGFVRNSYATGIVDTNATRNDWDFSGGLAGEIKSSATAVNCFSTSLVDGGLDTKYHSGLAGQLGGSLTYAQTTAAKAVYNALSVSTFSDIRTGRALNTFKTSSYFTDTGSGWSSAYPWDFTAVWTISATANDGFPTLRAQRVSPPVETEATTTASTATTSSTTASTTTATTTANEVVLQWVSELEVTEQVSSPSTNTEPATTQATTQPTTQATTQPTTQPISVEPTTQTRTTDLTTDSTVGPVEPISRAGRDTDLYIEKNVCDSTNNQGDIPSTGERQDFRNQTIGCLLVILSLLLAIATIRLQKSNLSAVKWRRTKFPIKRRHDL